LELTPEDAAFVETKLALSRCVRRRRAAQNVSQAALAKRLKSSQSRVAKMEAADATVSVDLLLRALFALGAKRRDIAVAIQKGLTAAAGCVAGRIRTARTKAKARMRCSRREVEMGAMPPVC
jgi:transcriptional regulator with XRE-family HTH domain